jgi:hypothetical protein
MVLRELASVVLTEDLPEYGLRSGDIGTIVRVHEGGTSYEVEFMTLTGETVAVVSLSASQVRPIAAREIAHVRTVEPVSP